MNVLTTWAGPAFLVLAMAAPPPPPVQFAGRLKVHLVADSIWDHCELTAQVDEAGRGTQAVGCKFVDVEQVPPVEPPPRDLDVSRIRQLSPIEKPLRDTDVARLRTLLREADLFRGQFWGSDLRGIDAPLITLEVHDGERVAVVVCHKNESFESGARRALLDWLSDRIATERGLK